MQEKIDIVRIDRAYMLTPEYRQLIQSLFVSGDVEKRLRYANWVFVENPALMLDEDLPIYLCRINGKDAGQIAIIPVEIVLAGEHIRAGWTVDFFVSPDFQRRGIGKKLLESAYIDFPVLMTLGQTDASFELFHSKLKWVFNNNRLTCYKSFLKKRFVVKYALLKMGLWKWRPSKILPLRDLNLSSGESLEIVESFDSYLENLSGEHIADNEVIGVLRTSNYLEWRYLNHPYIEYRICKITLSYPPCIHIVWRLQEDDNWCTAVIVDILYSESSDAIAMECALDIFLKFISEMGLERVECRTSDTLVLQVLRDNHLSQREQGQRFLYGKLHMETCPVIENERWQLYAGDCDVDTLNF